jgi:ribonuclease P protein subunit POP4
MHELIGLNVKVIASSDHQMIGLQGEVINETKNMLIIAPQGKQIMIPKKDCHFRFKLPTGELVDVDGSLLNKKTENRIKNVMRKRW